jgi:hypothetical protein
MKTMKFGWNMMYFMLHWPLITLWEPSNAKYYYSQLFSPIAWFTKSTYDVIDQTKKKEKHTLKKPSKFSPLVDW